MQAASRPITNRTDARLDAAEINHGNSPDVLIKLGAQSTRADPEGSRLAPIFIHSSFRTSSTWFWSKLRRFSHVYAFYEIFHGILASIDIETMVRFDSESWNSKHPGAAPYFLEFLPLLKSSGGVEGFEPAMTNDAFVPAGGPDGCLTPGESAYIQKLIDTAQSSGRKPLIACTRLLGRAKAVSKTFSGKHILLHRNIFHQWASYTAQYHSGNPYFIETIDQVIKASPHDAFLTAIDAGFAGRAANPNDEGTFATFILLHLYLYAHAFEAADLVVDATALAADRDYRRRTEASVSRLIDGDVDLSDACSHLETSVVEVANRPKFVDTINQFVKLISLGQPNAAASGFMETVKDGLLAEWDRHDFYTNGMSRYYRGRLDAQASLIAEAKTETRSVEQARDDLSGQVSAAIADREAAEAAAVVLAGERDRLAADLMAAAAERRSTAEIVAALTVERDRQSARLSEAAAERDAARMVAAALTAECERERRPPRNA